MSKKQSIILGTVILTLTGFLSRFIGFFYRIFLTLQIGADGIGMFQLVTPVLGIAFALCSAGIQTAISRFCAAKKFQSTWLFAGLAVALPLSVLFTSFTYAYAD
ncbi:MAG: polysaccharide biosynthesis protein, partial [Ruminococcus sp.]|nr:polysaccharide biosynthesis protein [Ruminococcus sp.]